MLQGRFGEASQKVALELGRRTSGKARFTPDGCRSKRLRLIPVTGCGSNESLSEKQRWYRVLCALCRKTGRGRYFFTRVMSRLTGRLVDLADTAITSEIRKARFISLKRRML